jgi:hypothetical protein
MLRGKILNLIKGANINFVIGGAYEGEKVSLIRSGNHFSVALLFFEYSLRPGNAGSGRFGN